MSMENVKKFMDLVRTEESLAKRMVAMKDGLQEGEFAFKNDKEFVEKKILPLAKESDLEFSVEDFMAVASLTLSELNNEDLQKVSGGLSNKSTAAGLLSLAALLASPLAMDAVSKSIDIDFGISHTASAETPEEKEQKEKLATAKEKLEENLKFLDKSDKLLQDGQALVKEADSILKPNLLDKGKHILATPDIRSCLDAVNNANIRIYTNKLNSTGFNCEKIHASYKSFSDNNEKISDRYTIGLDNMSQILEQIVKIKTELAKHEKDLGKESSLRDCVDRFVETSTRLLENPHFIDRIHIEDQQKEIDAFFNFIKLEKNMKDLKTQFRGLPGELQLQIKSKFDNLQNEVENAYPSFYFADDENTAASLIDKATKLSKEISNLEKKQKTTKPDKGEEADKRLQKKEEVLKKVREEEEKRIAREQKEKEGENETVTKENQKNQEQQVETSQHKVIMKSTSLQEMKSVTEDGKKEEGEINEEANKMEKKYNDLMEKLNQFVEKGNDDNSKSRQTLLNTFASSEEAQLQSKPRTQMSPIDMSTNTPGAVKPGSKIGENIEKICVKTAYIYNWGGASFKSKDGEIKPSYEKVNRRGSWEENISHLLGALCAINFDLSKLNQADHDQLKADLAWFKGFIKGDIGQCYAKNWTLYGTGGTKDKITYELSIIKHFVENDFKVDVTLCSGLIALNSDLNPEVPNETKELWKQSEQ